jgi:parallel beta-helix repeat protein
MLDTTQVACAAARAVLAALTAVASDAALAATIHVPADSATIQAAIERARAGDTVLVDAGTYHERLDFLGKAITVTSRLGAEQTIIDADGLGPVVRFHTGETRASILGGFTLQNGNALKPTTGNGGGVQISYASPTVQDSIITGNAGCSGNGIAAEFSSALIKNNHIVGNVGGCTGDAMGGGIYIGGAGGAEISGNLIEKNRKTGEGGGIAMLGAGGPLIVRNVIRGNKSHYDGGGISLGGDSYPTVADNVIYGNDAPVGGGIGLFVGGTTTSGGVWLNNTVADNVSNAGSELYAAGFASQAILTNNIFFTSNGASTVLCDRGFGAQSPVFVHNDFVNTSGAIGDGDGACPDPLASGDNLSLDPRFAKGKAEKAYRLSAGSPLIDAGTPAKQAGKLDAAGQDRVVDGDGDGVAVIDLGAFEFVSK